MGDRCRTVRSLLGTQYAVIRQRGRTVCRNVWMQYAKADKGYNLMYTQLQIQSIARCVTINEIRQRAKRQTQTRQDKTGWLVGSSKQQGASMKGGLLLCLGRRMRDGLCNGLSEVRSVQVVGAQSLLEGSLLCVVELSTGKAMAECALA